MSHTWNFKALFRITLFSLSVDKNASLELLINVKAASHVNIAREIKNVPSITRAPSGGEPLCLCMCVAYG